MSASIDEGELRARVREVLCNWPVVGLAVGVIKNGSLAWFYGHGVADVESGTPIDQDTVFRIASVTKTMTAIATMQLRERGQVDLDAPASDYLRAYRLIPARAGFRPVTLRHLLTHTAGVRAVRRPSDVLRPALGLGVRAGQLAPALAEYYQEGLPVDTEPGTKWAYSNNGFATLGQIVEDVSGLRLDHYLCEYVFGPLGMNNSDLVRSERVGPRLATGYEIRSRGPRKVRDLQMVQAGAGAVYSTTGDMARYVAALLGGGANSCGEALKPQTLAEMFDPHYQPDPRIPGMGLGFFRGQAGGYRSVGHDGIWLGFRSALALVPDEGIGVVALTNTGPPVSPFAATGPVAGAVLRSLLGLPEDVPATDVPGRPWDWDELCGSYSFGPGILTDPQPRILGPAVEVAARRDHLVVRGQLPVPAIRRGLRLYPDAGDPDVFRVILPGFGSGTSLVVFSRNSAGEVTRMHLGMLPMSFRKRPRPAQRPRRA